MRGELALCAIASCGLWHAHASARSPAEDAALLDRTVEAYFDGALQQTPSRATLIGDHRFDDLLEDSASPQYFETGYALARQALQAIAGIGPEALDAERRTTLEVFHEELRSALEGAAFPQHLLPIEHVQSVPELLARLGSGEGAQPFATMADYERFRARAERLPRWVEAAIHSMSEGMLRGITHPRVVMERLPPMLRAIGVQDVTASAFWKPILAMPGDWPASDRDRLTREWRETFGSRVLPAYRRLADFIDHSYLPAARASIAWTALPDGSAWYRYRVRQATTLDLDPIAVRATGLAEVARIHEEMERVRARVGFKGTLKDFFEFFQTDRRFYFESAESMLDSYREIKTRVDARLPELFGRLPQSDYQIRAIEAFRAAQVPGAQYQRGAPDGSRPGVFYVNTSDLKGLPNYIAETLSLHEASPGHHFQISIAQELTSLPRLRRFGQFTSYAEGWALYAESLGTALGLFEDPYQWYGHLTDEMLRAMRLVVDTGIHTQGWSREQAIRYMLDNSSVTESTARIEVDRYIVWPGQALAYKTGQLKITALREQAQRKLGARFDIRAFHDEVLGSGPLPLAVLEAKISRWIGSQREDTTAR